MTDIGRECVYVVDDDAAVLKSFSRLLRAEGLDAVPFPSARDFLEQADPDAAGCVILDLAMPGLDGLSLQKALAERGIEIPILFVSGRADIPKSVEAMKGGAVDFLTKPVSARKLVTAVREALEKDRAWRDLRAGVSDTRRRLATLTPRERDVLKGVVAGRLNKQIAADLGTAVKTVKIHRGRMMEKMGVSSVAELIHRLDNAQQT